MNIVNKYFPIKYFLVTKGKGVTLWWGSLADAGLIKESKKANGLTHHLVGCNEKNATLLLQYFCQ